MKYTKQYENDLRLAQDSVPDWSGMQSAKILVTGAAGLIGSTMVDLLLSRNDSHNAANDIYAAGRNMQKLSSRFGPKAGRSDLRFLPYEATGPVAFEEDFDYIIHAASPAFPAAFASNPVETMLANIMGMKYLLDYAARHPCRRLLYVSSSEVYGAKTGPEPYRENEFGFVDILNPRACYPSSKRATETLCSAYRAEYGTDFVIVRPGHIYGPAATASDNRAASAFARDAKAGRDIVMNSPGRQMRSYCYAIDCVSAMITVLLSGESGKSYNISNPDSIVSIRQLAECIAQNAGCKVVFQCPTEDELKSFNMMDNSSLNSESLEKLGWRGMFPMETAVPHMLEAME